MGQSVTIGTEAPTRLVAGAAHDLRNLLFVISAHSHRLQAMAEQAHPWSEDLRTIQEAADRCSELAAQILSEARILDQPARPLDINAVFHGVEPLLMQLIGDHVAMHASLTANLWPVTASSVQIEQILMNLVINARDAMPDGGELRITTENRTITGAVLGQPSHYVVLSVSDTGTGMAPDVQERMFEPYFTTKGSHGTGVGLATVRNITMLHAGHVEVTTAPGQGTTVRVILPRAPLPPQPVRVSPREEPCTATASLQVLIVESDPSAREFLRNALAAEGHRVAVAGNGAEAIGWYRTSDAALDVLVTDLFLPDVNALEIATLLRERSPDMRLVLLSDGQDLVQDEPGDVPVVVRPFTAAALSHALQRAVATGRTA
jgi:CheY-like chemotaxis protein